MADLERFKAVVERRILEMEDAFVRGDVGPRLSMWSHRDPVTLFAGLGPSKRGWAQLEPMFRKVASSVRGGRDLTYELVSADQDGDIGWAVGVARFTVSLDGGPARRMALRLTHLLRLEDGEWKIAHEHSDFQAADHEVQA